MEFGRRKTHTPEQKHEYTPEQKREWMRKQLAAEVASGALKLTPRLQAYIDGTLEIPIRTYPPLTPEQIREGREYSEAWAQWTVTRPKPPIGSKDKAEWAAWDKERRAWEAKNPPPQIVADVRRKSREMEAARVAERRAKYGPATFDTGEGIITIDVSPVPKGGAPIVTVEKRK